MSVPRCRKCRAASPPSPSTPRRCGASGRRRSPRRRVRRPAPRGWSCSRACSSERRAPRAVRRRASDGDTAPAARGTSDRRSSAPDPPMPRACRRSPPRGSSRTRRRRTAAPTGGWRADARCAMRERALVTEIPMHIDEAHQRLVDGVLGRPYFAPLREPPKERGGGGEHPLPVAFGLASIEAIEHGVELRSQRRVAGHGDLARGGRHPVPEEVAPQQRSGSLPAPVTVEPAVGGRGTGGVQMPALIADPGLDAMVLQQVVRRSASRGTRDSCDGGHRRRPGSAERKRSACGSASSQEPLEWEIDLSLYSAWRRSVRMGRCPRTRSSISRPTGCRSSWSSATTRCPRSPLGGPRRPTSDEDLATFAEMRERTGIDGISDVPYRPSVLPEHAHGWGGRPGVAAHRAGAAWASQFTVRSIDARRTAGRARRCSAGRTEPGRVRGARRLGGDRTPPGDRSLTRPACCARGQPYATRAPSAETLDLEGVTLALPIPTRASEILDFAGRWGTEKVPQRHPVVAGVHARESRRGRTGLDATTTVAIGTQGFDADSGQVWLAHVGIGGNHEHSVERIDGVLSFRGGELLFPGEVRLGSGESYESPWVYGSYGEGLDAAAHRYHRHLRAVSRSSHAGSPRHTECLGGGVLRSRLRDPRRTRGARGRARRRTIRARRRMVPRPPR